MLGLGETKEQILDALRGKAIVPPDTVLLIILP